MSAEPHLNGHSTGWLKSAIFLVIVLIMIVLGPPNLSTSKTTQPTSQPKLMDQVKLAAKRMNQATCSDVNKIYRDAAKDIHPDKGGGHDAMVKLNEAKGIAKKSCRRRKVTQPVNDTDDHDADEVEVLEKAQENSNNNQAAVAAAAAATIAGLVRSLGNEETSKKNKLRQPTPTRKSKQRRRQPQILKQRPKTPPGRKKIRLGDFH